MMKQQNRVHFIGCNPYAAMVQPKQQASLIIMGALIVAFLKFFSKIDFK